MNFSRVAVVGWLTAASTLLACSSSDTIVALNVSSTGDVGPVTQLHVMISQDGQTPFEAHVDVETTPIVDDMMMEVGTQITPFFERFKLPDSWEKKPAVVVVGALDASGAELLSAMDEDVPIRPEGASAAYVTLMGAPIMPPPDGGEAGSGAGGDGAGGAMGEGGAGAGGTDSGGAAGMDSGGTGGTSGSGGSGDDAGAGGT